MFDVKRNPQFKIGDRVTVTKLPPNLRGEGGMDTPGVFRRALGQTFRIQGVDDYGHLELVVAERKPTPATYQSDTIWIDPEFVALARKSRAKK